MCSLFRFPAGYYRGLIHVAVEGVPAAEALAPIFVPAEACVLPLVLAEEVRAVTGVRQPAGVRALQPGFRECPGYHMSSGIAGPKPVIFDLQNDLKPGYRPPLL